MEDCSREGSYGFRLLDCRESINKDRRLQNFEVCQKDTITRWQGKAKSGGAYSIWEIWCCLEHLPKSIKEGLGNQYESENRRLVQSAVNGKRRIRLWLNFE